MKINVLGTKYEVIIGNKKNDPKLNECDGYCDESTKRIVISDLGLFEPEVMDVEDKQVVRERILRHEVIHAMMFESGLGHDSEWAHNEEMVDWIARQFCKMTVIFKQIGMQI